jgi:hypothetical protein
LETAAFIAIASKYAVFEPTSSEITLLVDTPALDPPLGVDLDRGFSLLSVNWL